MLWFKRIAGQTIIPLGLIVISALLIWKWPFMLSALGSKEKTSAFLNILPILPYLVSLSCIIMGLRYNNTGLILTSFIIILVYSSIFFTGEKDSIFSLASSFLFPANLIFFSLVTKKRIFSLSGGFLTGLILAQISIVSLFSAPDLIFSNRLFSSILEHLHITIGSIDLLNRDILSFFNGQRWAALNKLTIPSAIMFLLSMTFFTIRFIMSRDIIVAGYLGSLISIFLGFTAVSFIPGTSIYFMVAGLILLFTNIEASFFRAYVDELTGLHGRRSLNETMVNLGRKYTIAMLDIDHFKKFNDTFGHKTGDDVLKMVAKKLETIAGKSKVFRYGGEEFTAVFPGKTTDEAIPYLEQFRLNLENSLFNVREKERKKGGKKNRGRSTATKQVQITMSIGVAGAEKKASPEKVIKLADKALYKAKKAGRNCVRTL